MIQHTTTAELSTTALRQLILNGDIIPGSRVTEEAMQNDDVFAFDQAD